MRHIYRRHCSKVVTAAGQERVLLAAGIGRREGGGMSTRGREGSSLVLAYSRRRSAFTTHLSFSFLHIGNLISPDNARLR